MNDNLKYFYGISKIHMTFINQPAQPAQPQEQPQRPAQPAQPQPAQPQPQEQPVLRVQQRPAQPAQPRKLFKPRSIKSIELPTMEEIQEMFTGKWHSYVADNNQMTELKSKSDICNTIIKILIASCDKFQDKRVGIHKIDIAGVPRDRKTPGYVFVFIIVGCYTLDNDFCWELFGIHTHYLNVPTIKYDVSKLSEHATDDFITVKDARQILHSLTRKH